MTSEEPEETSVAEQVRREEAVNQSPRRGGMGLVDRLGAFAIGLANSVVRMPGALLGRRRRDMAPDGRRDTAPGRPARRIGDQASSSASRSGNDVPEVQVAAMFDQIAPVYDRLNTIMTFGLDGRWRRAAVEATGVTAGGSVVDVACGTGKLAGALADRVGPFGRVVGVDLSGSMIDRARNTYRDVVQLEFRVANALGLPFRNGEFDAATIAFGLRNLADYESGLRELARTVRAGGWVVCLELSLPRPRPFGVAYHAVFRAFAPLVGSAFGQRGAYEYLPASLAGFPDPDRLARTMRAAGLVGVSYRRLAFGAVALHRGQVPVA